MGLLGGLRVEHDGRDVPVSGTMQLAVLFRLAVDAGAVVGYRAMAEDIWPLDGPANTRAALQSIVSRLRAQLPDGVIESAPGGYRLLISRNDVDALRFQDLVAQAEVLHDAAAAARLASDALDLWTGEPWSPSADFDWFGRDLLRDRARAIELGGTRGGLGHREGSSAIPAPLTALVGRELELATVFEQLEASRLVTIIGTGGSGKTRLAIEAAGDIGDAVLVELAPVEASEIWQTVLAATGRELRTAESSTDPVDPRTRVLEGLLGRSATLVFDNCEHLIDGAAVVVHELLSSLPRLRILTTSREPLGLGGEAFVPLGALAHPSQSELDAGLTPIPGGRYPAIELFRQRAVAARGRELEDDELRAAAQICLRLDGLPLAIELAAAKLRTMTVAEVLDGLEDRFRLLTGGPRSVLPRHQTLRAMIDWSWSLLDEDERAALAGLAVFPAGVAVVDAQHAAAAMGLDSASVFDRLVDRSLLQRSRGRFRALETVREYGIERLASAGTLQQARHIQASHLVERATVYDTLLRGPRIHEAVAWFDAEDDNLTAALRYSVQSEVGEVATRLLLAITWYLMIRDRISDTRNWFEAVSPLAASVQSDEALVIRTIGSIAEVIDEGDGDESDEMLLLLVRLLEPLEQIDVRAGGNEVLQLVGPFVSSMKTITGAASWQHSVRIPFGEELGLDPWPTAFLHLGRAILAQNRSDLAEQGRSSELSLRMFTSIGDSWGLAIAQQFRAEWLSAMGRLGEALELTDRSTDTMRSITSSADLMQQQQLAVSIMLRSGDLDGAQRRAEELLAEATSSGSTLSLAQAHLTAATVATARTDAVEASRQLALLDGLTLERSESHAQFLAQQEVARAGVAVLRGELDVAEASLRVAVGVALRSQDHPILVLVALALGHYHVARGRIVDAARALEVADAIRGIPDDTELWSIEIRAAMRTAGIGSSGTAVPEDPILALGAILGE
jgi:predicted ATPase